MVEKYNDQARVFIVSQWEVSKTKEKINGMSKQLDMDAFRTSFPGYFAWAAHEDTKVGTRSKVFSLFDSVGKPIKMKIERIA
jgi:hypothetical protein